ncbi:MAG TPA: hypothetical protein VMB73_08310 [Acetobacteraceae bacterium]|nr:hypothetical protein [Acetobacteraceae bacterium]
MLPLPTETLALGATHPDALAWLATHWGVTDRLRQVVLRPGASAGRRLPRGDSVIGYGFFTAGETPHRAIAALAARFSPLRFALLPRPGGLTERPWPRRRMARDGEGRAQARISTWPGSPGRCHSSLPWRGRKTS